ncbi:MAG: MG2 domain-containing protein, partial [Spirochaetales bacterium]|nr:MG2 domain-containing protein [Spirochaetales bacterium]
MSENKKKITDLLKKIFISIFGSFQYTPPEFAVKLMNKAEDKGISFSKISRRIRKILIFTLLGAAALVILLLGVAFLYDKWQTRQPKAIMVSYRVTEPSSPGNSNDLIPPLRILFQGSAATKEMANSIVNEGITMKPAVQGTWFWKGDNILLFEPAEAWGIDTSYDVTLAKSLFPSHVSVNSMKFSFDTPAVDMTISSPEFYIDPVNATLKRVLVTLKFNYPVVYVSMVGKVRIYPDLKSDSGSLENRDYRYDISYSENGREVYITSEPVGMPLKDVEMNIEVSGGIEVADGRGRLEKGGSRNLDIPGIGSYVKINSLSLQLIKNEQQNYDQILVLDTKGETPSRKLLDYLEIWQLPRDLPDLPGVKGIEYIRWSDPEFVTDEVIKLAEAVECTVLPTELETTSLHSFMIDVDPGKYLYIRVKEGASFYGGYHLAEDYEKILQVRDYPRELQIVSEGNLLSLSGDKRLSVFSRGITNVGYKIHRILPDDINHLVSQSNGNLTNFNFKNYNFSINNISKTYDGKISLNRSSSSDLQYFSLDVSKYLNHLPSESLRHGLFMIELGELRSNNSLQVLDKRLIIVSDLGMLLKVNQDGSRDLFVQSIATGSPVSGATVSVLGRNGIPLMSETSDNSGHVQFGKMEFSRRENTPTAFIVTKGEDLSFLPYEAPGRFLDFSGSDVGGVYGAGDPGQLTTQIFSDRGLYRPGDRVNGAFIIKAGDWNRSLGGTPLVLNVEDPKGQQIYEESIILSADGFNEFSFDTQDYSSTGEYKISLYLVNEKNRKVYLGGDEIKVEEFLPDRMKVISSFSRNAKGWISPDSLEAYISVRNLYGSPASGNRVTGTYRLDPASLYFPQYREYRFLQPERSSMSITEELNEGLTDDEGKLSFSLPLDSYEKASYRLMLSVDAFEKAGGRSVASSASILVSPLDYLVGYKADGDLGYIHKDGVRQVDLIAVNPDLETVAVPDARLRISRINYVSTLVKQPNGVYKYESIEQSEVIAAQPLAIKAENTVISLDSSTPGNYIAEVLDTKNNVLSRFRYSVVGEANLTRSLNRSADLEIKLDKSDYRPGDSIEISISAPYAGSGLITIERDRVYTHKWFKTDSTSTMQTIQVPGTDLEGNGYVTVSFIRAPDSEEIFMSPLSYGSVPFSLSKDNRTQNISLDIPALVKPGEELPITYSSDKRGRIIVYAVDEGILQVGRYTLPDPLSFFFRKRALEVKTAQILDLILPEYSIIRRFSEMGGGESSDMIASNLNPFKRKDLEPVVFWSGILESGPEKRTVSYTIPNHFNGSVKIMAVCVSNAAVGSTESSVLVQDTFIIQPSAPLAVIPGDQFSFQATVANNLAGSGESAEIDITLETEEGLIPSVKSLTMSIPEGKDGVVRIPVTVGDTLGASSITLTASSGGEVSRMVHPLSIRPATPYRTSVFTSVLDKRSESV